MMATTVTTSLDETAPAAVATSDEAKGPKAAVDHEARECRSGRVRWVASLKDFAGRPRFCAFEAGVDGVSKPWNELS
jgi:hypothetical protein